MDYILRNLVTETRTLFNRTKGIELDVFNFNGRNVPMLKVSRFDYDDFVHLVGKDKILNVNANFLTIESGIIAFVELTFSTNNYEKKFVIYTNKKPIWFAYLSNQMIAITPIDKKDQTEVFLIGVPRIIGIEELQQKVKDTFLLNKRILSRH